MIKLSFSTCNALINEPHTYLNKQMKLKTFSTPYFEAGKAAHRVIQDWYLGKTVSDNVSGLLSSLPEFDLAEEKDFDERLHVQKEINDKYLFHGYVDLLSHSRRRFGDIKSGTPWSPRKMSKHMQFKLYSWATGYREFFLINVPKDQNEWSDKTLKVLTMEFSEGTDRQAQTWLMEVIDKIENYDKLIPTFEKLERRSPWCYYVNCPYCPSN